MCLNGSSSQDLSGKEEAWNYYMEIFDVIENRSQVKLSGIGPCTESNRQVREYCDWPRKFGNDVKSQEFEN